MPDIRGGNAGMHNEDVPLGSNLILVLVAA